MITRTTTLSRPKILEEIFEIKSNKKQNISTGNLEFFNVGYPGKLPVSPVGSILVSLKNNFLGKNKNYFSWGSVGDNGGVKNGFIPCIPKSDYKKLQLDYDEFIAIMSIINNLDQKEKELLYNNKTSTEFIDKARHILSEHTIKSILEYDIESARRIEFCLTEIPEIKDNDIIEVYIPNTYKSIFNKSNCKFSNKKLKYYNPKLLLPQLKLLDQ